MVLSLILGNRQMDVQKWCHKGCSLYFEKNQPEVIKPTSLCTVKQEMKPGNVFYGTDNKVHAGSCHI